MFNPEPQIVTVTNTVKTTAPIVARPKGAQISDVKIYVVTAENYDEFVEKFTSKERRGLRTLLFQCKGLRKS